MDLDLDLDSKNINGFGLGFTFSIWILDSLKIVDLDFKSNMDLH